MSKIYGRSCDLGEYTGHQIIIDQIKPNSTVLEFGCGAGATTSYLKNKLNCNMRIVEYVPEAFEIAKEHAVDGYCGDADTLEWYEQFKDVKFDTIIFCDVLEHLRRPAEALKCCKELLKDDGKILTCIPNTCNGALLAEMYGDNFHYSPFGLLDDTHVHLFSYNSTCRMVADLGLEIILYDLICKPLEETEFRIYPNILPKGVMETIRNKPMANVYQFMFTFAKPNQGHEIVNRMEERIGFTSKMLINDKYGFPVQSFDACVINKKKINLTLNINKKINTSIDIVPMYNSGCILENVKVIKDGVESDFNTNAHLIDGKCIFLNNDDVICCDDLSETSVLRVTADIIYN